MANPPFLRARWWPYPSAQFPHTAKVQMVKTVSTTWKSRLRKVDEMQTVPLQGISNRTNRATEIN